MLIEFLFENSSAETQYVTCYTVMGKVHYYDEYNKEFDLKNL